MSATYVLPKNLVKENSLTVQASKVGKGKASYSSIITEDDSDDDLPLQVPKTKKNNKELFEYVNTERCISLGLSLFFVLHFQIVHVFKVR